MISSPTYAKRNHPDVHSSDHSTTVSSRLTALENHFIINMLIDTTQIFLKLYRRTKNIFSLENIQMR